MLTSGAALDYDWLVLALGSETNTFGVPGAREHAITFCSYDDVQKACLPSRLHLSQPGVPCCYRQCRDQHACMTIACFVWQLTVQSCQQS